MLFRSKREIENFPWTPEKIEEYNQVLREIGQNADKSIVTVSSVKHQMDWFDNPVESTGQYAGMILAANAGEVVILAGEEAVENADSLRIVFGDGGIAPGALKGRDMVCGMVTLTVNTADLSDTTRDWIQAIDLGNSYTVRVGDMMVAVGSPAGHVHSVKRGIVSYVARGVQTADGNTRVLYTDFDCDTEKGTFFLNLSGQLVGWATDFFGAEEMDGVTMVMPISE